MSFATINGSPEQYLKTGLKVQIRQMRGINLETCAQVMDFELCCFSRDELVWGCKIDRLNPCPMGIAPQSLDYHYVDCPLYGFFVLTGYDRAIVISAETGRVCVEVSLEFSDVSSLNYLHVEQIISGTGGVMIACESVVVRLDKETNRLWSWNPVGPLTKCIIFEHKIIAYNMSMEQSGMPYFRTELGIDSGEVIGSILTESLPSN